MPVPAPKDRYTFADCLTWDENERIEIINGEAVMMAPPSRTHQEVSGELFRQLANFLEGKKCRVYSAPFAVRPFEQFRSLGPCNFQLPGQRPALTWRTGQRSNIPGHQPAGRD